MLQKISNYQQHQVSKYASKIFDQMQWFKIICDGLVIVAEQMEVTVRKGLVILIL